MLDLVPVVALRPFRRSGQAGLIMESQDLETDPRFPSGPWIGYFLQHVLPGRHWMELQLTFRQGVLTGKGRDRVGSFIVRGRYKLEDGRCYWSKRYLGKHDVFYQGYNEGKGIWGVWEIPGEEVAAFRRGGFHIWPKGMSNSSEPQLGEAAALPEVIEEEAAQRELIGTSAE